MDEQVKIPALNLEEMTSGGNDSFSYDSVTDNNTTAVSVAVGTKEKKNSIRDEDIDYKTRIKRHTEKDNEILIGDQVRREATEPPEGFVLLESIHESFFLTGAKIGEKKKSKLESHLAEELRNDGSVCLSDTSRSSPSAEPHLNESPKMIQKCPNENACEKENTVLPSTEKAIAKLKRQKYQLMEALVKTQKNHEAEKKRFHEILFGLDKALSSLPIRLEKIRVRNQRNLSIINSSRFNSGDVNVNFPLVSGSDTTITEETSSSQESNCYLSIRMQCLLRKMNQLNELIHTIKQGDSSPIELLVDSELYAISLLKKEIKSTKKRIDESKTDTETVTSCGVSSKGDSTEDSASKAKNSFSNALNNASNFKIFENHMIFQEEAMNLLTRKIRETEEELLKEMEANESLRRENETMAKEIFRLKSAGEGTKGEKFQKIEKLKAIVEETGNRPYRLIKELKAKLDEKEKTLIAWKSKYSRLESTNSNKSALLENEKKKNFEMEVTIKNLRSQSKNLTAHLSSLEFVNQQLKDQCEILKAQVELLAKERREHFDSKKSRIGEQVAELNVRLQDQEAKAKKAEKAIKETKEVFETQLAEAELRLRASQKKNEEFFSTFKELLNAIHSFWMKKERNSTNQLNYKRIREILHITPSDLDLLLDVCGSDSKKQVEELYAEFKSIVAGDEKFSSALSSWFFDIIREKLLHQSSNDENPTHFEET